MVTSTEQLNKSFLDEYNSDDAIRKYSTQTAGDGVSYLIKHDYASIYDEAIAVCRQTSKAPLRLLEFGCGAGMNIIGLLARLDQQSIAVELACGTDFSASLIESAKTEAATHLPPALGRNLTFHVARNETLATELPGGLRRPAQEIMGRFDFIFGVNTFRYCHRLGNAHQCATDIHRLLRPGGVVVMIDMNNRFPLFRSRFRGTIDTAEEAYLPTLDEYTEPFTRATFQILRTGNFCWVPHSAGPTLTAVCRALSPVLNLTMRSCAMRSLVIARKPV